MQPDMNVTLDTLHLVFSAFGLVQKIATFEKGQGFQALVQYADAATAEQVSGSMLPRATDPGFRFSSKSDRMLLGQIYRCHEMRRIFRKP